MDLFGNPMGASVASASDQQRGAAALPPRVQQRFRLRRASSAVEGAKVAKKARADGAKVVAKARVLKRHKTPDLTNLCLKRAWFAATSLDGLSGVFIPTVKKKGYEYAAIAPTTSKWFTKLCFGVSYYKTINSNAIREVLARIWRGIEEQLGGAPKDF